MRNFGRRKGSKQRGGGDEGREVIKKGTNSKDSVPCSTGTIPWLLLVAYV